MGAIGQAMFRFHDALGTLPPRGTSSPGRGWVSLILDYTEDPGSLPAYRTDLSWTAPENQPAIMTQLPTFQCPATPDPTRLSKSTDDDEPWQAACTDFVANGGVAPQLMWAGWLPPDFPRDGVFMVDKYLTRGDIIDGESETLMVVETAGRPAHYALREVVGKQRAVKGPWAHIHNHIECRGHTENGKEIPGSFAVNISNADGVYSFHPDRAHLLMCDGSVRAAGLKLDVFVLYAMATPNSGDLIELNSQDWAPDQEEN